MDVQISKSSSGDSFLIEVDGELDVYTAPHLKEVINEGISGGHKKLVVDLRRVGFLDSTALGVLIGGLRRMRVEEGDLELVLDDPHLTKMFRITGLDGVFRIHKTLSDATGAVN